MVTPERRAESERLCRSIVRWAESRPDVCAIAVVGSWARNEPRMDSDLDIVVLTDEKLKYINTDDWIEDAVGEPAAVVRRMDWGPLLTERRLRLGSGFYVEFGFAPPSWAATDPVDSGTADVVRGGCEPLYDPDQAVAHVIEAVC